MSTLPMAMWLGSRESSSLRDTQFYSQIEDLGKIGGSWVLLNYSIRQ